MTEPPYPPSTAGIGGVPSTSVDVPILAVFITLYIVAAVSNMTIFRLNRRRGHKFIISGVLFGFCMSRIATCTLRIVWATRSTNARVAIAAEILVNAGILLVYIVNLLLAQRILRARKPHIGWNPWLSVMFKAFYALIFVALVLVITTTVLSLYTLNLHTRSIARDIQLAAITYLLIFTTLPLLLLAASFLPPASVDAESFGEGSMISKASILTLSCCLCVLIAGFKAGTAWEKPRPISKPAWYDSKAAFYIFSFTLEILLLLLFLLGRIDKRFYVPDGSTKPGDYSRSTAPSENGNEDTSYVEK